MMLKEQLEGVLRENTILKHAVAIQHERQKHYEDKNQELQQLKQLVSQYQEQLRTLEVRITTTLILILLNHSRPVMPNSEWFGCHIVLLFTNVIKWWKNKSHKLACKESKIIPIRILFF